MDGGLAFLGAPDICQMVGSSSPCRTPALISKAEHDAPEWQAAIEALMTFID